MEDNESVLSFKNPKVQAAVSSNTFAITGSPVEKKINELLPSVLTQLDQTTLLNYINKMKDSTEAAGVTGSAGEGAADDVPELVPDFEEVSEEK